MFEAVPCPTIRAGDARRGVKSGDLRGSNPVAPHPDYPMGVSGLGTGPDVTGKIQKFRATKVGPRKNSLALWEKTIFTLLENWLEGALSGARESIRLRWMAEQSKGHARAYLLRVDEAMALHHGLGGPSRLVWEG
jgi:hypothetical protein